jgi:hypothetical protein
MSKNIISFVCSLLLVTFIGFASDPVVDKTQGPELKFDNPAHNYGTAYVDSMPNTKLAIPFTNSGSQPLILSSVRACCGTRVTQWPSEPIAPGGKGVINIEFTLAPRAQRISRTVTVTSNSETNPTAIFRIQGEIAER